MDGLSREVELEIRARDYTGKTVNEIRKSLRAMRDELEEQRKAARSGAADMAKYDSALKGITDSANHLASLTKQVSAFEGLGQSVAELRNRLATLRSEQAELADAIERSGSTSKAQQGYLKRLEQSVTTTTRNLERQTQNWQKARLELELQGVATADLAKATQRLNTMQGVALNMVINARSEQARLTQTNADAAKQATAHAAALERQAKAQAAVATAAKVTSVRPQPRVVPSSIADNVEAVRVPDTSRANQTLQQLRELVRETSRQIADGVKDVAEYTRSLERMGAASSRLKNLATVADNFHRQRELLRSMGAEYGRLMAEFRQLEQVLRGSGAVTAQQEQRFYQLAAQLEKMAVSIGKQRGELQAAKSILSAAGVSTKTFAASQHDLVSASDALVASQRRVQAAINDTREAQARAAQQAKEQVDMQSFAQGQAALDAKRRAINASIKSLKELAQAEREAAAEQQGFAGAIRNTVQSQERVQQTFEDTRRTIVSMRGAYRDAARDADKLREAQTQLKAAQLRLVGLANMVDDFRQVKTEMGKLSAEYASLRSRHEQLDNAMRYGVATEAQAREMASLAAQIERTGRAYAQTRVRFETARDALHSAGIATDRLADEQRKLVSSANASAAAMHRLEAAGKRFAASQHHASIAMRDQINSSRTALDLFQRLRGQVLALTSAYVGLFGAIELVNKVIQAGKDGYQLKVSAELLEGDDWAKNLEGGMEKYFRDTADRMGLSLRDTVRDATKFFVAVKETGRSFEQAAYTWEQFTGLGKLMGLDNETMSRVNKALEQMFSKGKVSAEELRQQLGDALPNATALLTKALGVTRAELDEMLKRGEVGSESMILAAANIEQQYGELIADTFSNLQSEQNRLNNAWQDWLRIINDAGVADNFKQLVIDVRKFLTSDEGRTWALRIASAINTVIDALRWCLENVELLVGALSVLGGLVAVQALSGFAVGLALLAKRMLVFKGMVSATLLNLGKFMGVIGTGATSLGGFAGALRVVGRLLSRVFLPIAIGIELVRALWELFGDTVKFEVSFEAVGDAIWLVTSALEAMYDIVREVFKAGILIISGTINTVTELVKGAFDLFSDLLGVFGKENDKAADDTSKSWLDSFDLMEDGFTGFVQLAARALDALVASFKGTARVIGSFFDTMWRKARGEAADFRSVEDILTEVSGEQSENGFEAQFKRRLEERRKLREQAEEEEKRAAQAKPDLEGITGRLKAEDDAEGRKRVEDARQKAERAREQAEQAALRRLEAQLTYEKMLENRRKHFQGLLDGDTGGTFADYMRAQRSRISAQYAAPPMDTTAIADSVSSIGQQVQRANEQVSQHSRQELQATTRAAAAAAYATNRSLAQSAGECAKRVRLALESQGLVRGGLGHGHEVARRLINSGRGFQEVKYDATYKPQIGDVMSLPRGMGQSREFGHVAIWNGKNWVSDYVQRVRGNTAATNDTSLRNIQSGRSVPTIARYTGRNAGIINGGVPSAAAGADYWTGRRQADAVAAAEDSFNEKLDELVKQVDEKAREALTNLFKDNGIVNVDALVNMRVEDITLDGSSTLEDLRKGFDEHIAPNFKRQADDLVTLIATQLENRGVGTEQAKAVFDNILPKIQQLYSEKAAQEFRKLIDERFNKMVDAAQKHVEGRDAYVKALQAQITSGAVTPEQAMRRMLAFQQQNTAEIQKQVDAIDRFLASADAEKLDANQRARFMQQRESLAAQTANGGIGQANAARDAANALAEAQIARINALIQEKINLEQSYTVAVQAGLVTVSDANTQQEAQIQAINAELRQMVQNAMEARNALSGTMSADVALQLNQSIGAANTSMQDLGRHGKTLEAVGANLTSGFTTMFEAAAQGIAGLVTGNATLEETFAGLRNSFLQWVAEFLMNIAKMILQQAILVSLQAAAEKNPAGSGLIGTIIQGAIAALGGITAGVKHSGGIVGGAGSTRMVSPMLFANAPRYHSGGVAGLLPNEVPAILQRGEEVLTKQDPRHRDNGGGSNMQESQPITVINTFDPVDAMQKALASAKGRKVLIQANAKEGKAMRSFGGR